jgi:RNA polymerase sigma factor (sigma-70 family)
MDAKPVSGGAMAEIDRSIVEAFVRERARLRGFIRRRVPDPADVEDIVQEVFYEFVEVARLPRPVEQVGAWLFRVARNRITDLFRKDRTRGSAGVVPAPRFDDAADADFEDLLPSARAGPEAAYARRVLFDELEDALQELPPEQRDVFVAHELDGLSFKELAERTGVGINTLLSRKHYAVLHLRRRLQEIHDEFVNP